MAETHCNGTIKFAKDDTGRKTGKPTKHFSSFALIEYYLYIFVFINLFINTYMYNIAHCKLTAFILVSLRWGAVQGWPVYITVM